MSNNSQICVATPSTVTAISDPAVKAAAACAAEEVQRRTYTSTLDGLRKIVANEGLTTLWRGLSPTLVMAIPANVLYFASYDWLRFNSKSPFRRINMNETYIPLAAGSSARIIAAIAVGPIEIFRTRMQAAHNIPGKSGKFVETLQGLKEMTSQRGYRSLWTGLTLTLWRDVPFSALYWWGYEYGRDALRESRQKRQSHEALDINHPESGRRRRQSRGQEDHTTTLIDSFVAGAASGAFAALVTTPFDVGKTRQQTLYHSMDSAMSSGAAKVPEELPMPRFLWHIFQTQGTAGLFRGWAARCLKVAPACAIMISVYEGSKAISGIHPKRYQT
jgi:solute carrier family 25 protein 39/40